MSGSRAHMPIVLRRSLVAIQVFLLVATLFAPVPVVASEPSADSGASLTPTTEPSSEPTPSAEPTSAPDPAPMPEPAPSDDPGLTPSPEPSTEPTTEPTPAPAPTDAYVVSFATGVTGAEQSAAIAAAGATTTDTIGVLRIHAVDASQAAVDALRADKRVSSVELDRSRAVEAAPDDTRYPTQWALPVIGWDDVYGVVDPAGSAVVAILDTGVAAGHPDLDGVIVSGASFVAGSSWSTDPNGHGTAMAGIVAAETGNGTDIAGVGFDGVSVMPITVLGADGLGLDSDIVEGLVWAADHGADVALLAFSANGYSSALQAAVDYAWSKGVVIVAAAGNDGASTPAYPAGDAGVIGVSSTTSTDTVAANSNTGASIFLAAPGAGILSLGREGTTYISGTSAAAAHVAGAAALLAVIDPDASNGAIVGRLARSADLVGTQAETGNGRLNLARAAADISTGEIRPSGAAPTGDGGPFVGPYVAAAVTANKTGPAFSSPGASFAYSIQSVGNGNQGNITVTDTVPAGLTVGAPTGTGSSGTSSCSKVGNAVTCTLTGAGNNATYTVTIPVTVPAGAANGSTYSNTATANCSGNCSGAVTSNTVVTTIDTLAPTVTSINRSAASPTSAGSVSWSVTFSEAVTGVNAADFALAIVGLGGAPAITAVTSATASTYTVTASTGTGSGSIGLNLVDDDSIRDLASNRLGGTGLGNGSFAGQTYTVDRQAPIVTLAAVTASPTNAASLVFTLTGNKDLDCSTLSTGSGSDFTFTNINAITSINGTGTPTCTIAATSSVAIGSTGTSSLAEAAGFSVSDTLGNPQSNISTGSPASVTVDRQAPTVTIDQTSTQADPSNTSPINFTVVFSEAVSNFATGDVTITGTAGGTKTATVTGSGTTYNVAVTGMTTSGTVIASIAAGVATDAAGNDNTASTSTDNAVTWSANQAPTDIGLSNASVAENAGADATVGTLSTTDPDSGSTFTYSLVSGTGSTGNGAFNISGSTLRATASLDFEAQNSYSVRIRTTDQGGLFFEKVFTITVTDVNETPSVTLAALNDLDVNEGSQHTYAFAVADPDVSDSFTVLSVSCGLHGSQVGATSTTPTGGSFICRFPDGPATSTVSVRVEDAGGLDSDVSAQVVTIGNVKPSISLSGPPTVDEGSTHEYAFTITDPGDDTHTITTACGANGAKVPGSQTYDSLTGLGSVDCFFADGPATTSVTATVTDSDGATDTDNQAVSVTVTNVAPTVTLSPLNTVSVDEGTTHTYAFTTSDPGTDTFTLIGVDCGPGTQFGSTSFDALTGSGNFACTFPDGPATDDVTVQVQDPDLAPSNVASQTVTVANAAPTVTLSAANDLDALESETHTYTFTVSDPGLDAFSVLDVDCGDAGVLVTDSLATIATGGSFDCIFPDGPGTTSVSVRVEDSDGADSNVASQSVQIANVAPTVALTGPESVNEGTSHTYTFTVSDPGDDEFTAPPGFPACGLAGELVPGSLEVDADGGSFDCSFPDGAAQTQVRIKVIDSDGASDIDSEDVVIVEIANVPPVISAIVASPGTIDEGGSTVVSVTASDDAGAADPLTYAFDCDGDDVADQTGASNEVTCTFDDGPSSHIISVVVTDGDGGQDSAALAVIVDNVAPTATLSNGGAVNEGSTGMVSFTDQADASAADEATGFTYSYDFDDDGIFEITGSSSPTAVVPASYLADGPASRTVAARITDKDGGSTDYDTTITVDNVDPTVQMYGPILRNEGDWGWYTFRVTDPGADTFNLEAVSCGAGSLLIGSPDFDGSSGIGDFICSFPDGPTDVTVSVTVSDDDGGSHSASVFVAVHNVAPTVLAGLDTTLAEGSTLSRPGRFTDPGADSWTATVDYGDGSGVQALALIGKTFNLSHTYADGPAMYTVTVAVTDDDGGTHSSTFEVTVTNVVPSIGLAGDATTNEGATYTLTLGTVTDPGQDTVTWYIVHWGDMTSSTYPADGTVTHVYADGPASFTITVDLVDEDGTHTGVATKRISVLNVAPVVVLSGDASDVNEGTTRTYTYTATDAGNDPMTITESCGANATRVDTPAANSFDCVFPDGPASTTVSVTADDGDPTNNIGTDSKLVTIKNVAPTVPVVSVTIDPYTHLATVTATYSDPGADTHTGTFLWSHGGSTPVVRTASGGTSVDSRVLPNGCYNLSVAVTVTDSDGATGNETGTKASADAYAIIFDAPIKDNERNIAKYGNVVPVKVNVMSSCSGTAVTSADLYITLTEGVHDPSYEGGTNLLATSVSSADTDSRMRLNGGGYVYNLSTKPLTQGKDYTLRIRIGSTTGPIIQSAVLQPKK